MNLPILTTHRHYVNDWTLHNTLNVTGKVEGVDHFRFRHIPQFHSLSAIEEQFVYIGDWMHETNKVFVRHAHLFTLFATLEIVGNKFRPFSQNKHQVLSDYKLKDWVF